MNDKSVELDKISTEFNSGIMRVINVFKSKNPNNVEICLIQ